MKSDLSFTEQTNDEFLILDTITFLRSQNEKHKVTKLFHGK